MKIELRPTGHQWTWLVREGNVTSLAGKRFNSPNEALQDARADFETEADGDDLPPVIA
jgi:hypothetical protein